MRAIVASIPSTVTAIAWALACISLCLLMVKATWPGQKMSCPLPQSPLKAEEKFLLRAGVAGAFEATGQTGGLYQPGAINTRCGIASPKIGRAQKHHSDADWVS